MKPTDPSDADDGDFARRLRAAVALGGAPPAWLRAAEGLWPAAGPSLAGAARRLLAALRFDSAAAGTLSLQGVRGGSAGARHLLFSTEGRDIDLRITPAGGAHALAGQVLGPDEAGEVEIAGSGAPSLRTALNELGEFRIDGVPPGRYRLVLRLGGDEIVLPDIDVGDGAD
jgi:hypothetical protein